MVARLLDEVSGMKLMLAEMKDADRPCKADSHQPMSVEEATASGTIPAQAADSDRLPDTADASDGIPTTKDLLYKILELQTCRIEDDKRLSEKEQRK